MNQPLIGRTHEIAELEAALASPKPEMLALIGRRRIGKTFLVRRVYDKSICFELTGLQSATLGDQLRNFMFAYNRYFPGRALAAAPVDWLAAFHELGLALDQLPKNKRPVLFLDELPWLATRRSKFITALAYFWNSWASTRSVVLVVCGSAASWMIRKLVNDRGGLHNRITRLLFLQPFTLSETEAYCQARHIRLNRYQLTQLYMVMGGIPMYLDQLEPGRSAIQNIQAICFAPNGYLRTEFNRLFASLFNGYERHVNIVQALASKRSGLYRDEIATTARLQNGGGLTKLLDELEASGFITVYGGYGKRTRERLYRLTDFYTHFYLTFIIPLGKGAQIEFTRLSDLPRWKSWAGYTFENLCLTHINPIRNALGISGISSSVSTFRALPKGDTPGTQIDLVIDRSDQSINLCEIKFAPSELRLSKKMRENLESKKEVFRQRTKTKKHLFTTVIAPYGVALNDHRAQVVDQVVTLDDLFTGKPR